MSLVAKNLAFVRSKARWFRCLIAGVLLASTSGCAEWAVQPTPIPTTVVTTPTPTLRPTVTPLLPDTPAPTLTPSPTSTPSLTPAPTSTPTATPAPTATPRRPASGELGVSVEISSGLVISNTPVPPPASIVDLPKGTINVLLLGSDNRPGEALGRTDSIIVVSVNPVQQYVTLLSIPRDLWVFIPGLNKFDRINTADLWGARYKIGKRGELLAETIRYNLGIPINYYAFINFAGVQQIIDKLGGVDVLARCPLYDVFPDLPPGQNDIITDTVQLSTVPTGTIDIKTPGLYTLDGKHALWYARSRYSTSDFDRSRRQQTVLKAVWGKIKAEGLIAQLPNLWGDLSSLVTTNLSLNDVLFLAQFGSQLDDSQIKLRAIDQLVVTSFTTASGAAVLAIQPDRMALVVDEAFTPPLSNVASQSTVRVEVWNGSGRPNWDLLAVDRLTSQGFIVPSYITADQTYTQTLIINYTSTNKGSRLNQLMRLFNMKQSQVITQPDDNSPIAYRLIVGPDFDACKPSAPLVAFPPTPTPTPTAQP
jgi:polyisoprenyl-teichoic acid--peptidoglycan teichoic acid transferase